MKFFVSFMCILCQLFAQDQFSQIRCSSLKIKEGCLEEVKAYYQSAMEERREAVLETFANEGMLIECGFIKEENGSHYLILFLRAHDMDKAREAYRNSTLEEDLLHRAFGRKCFEHHEVLSPIYHLEAVDFSKLIMAAQPLEVEALKIAPVLKYEESENMKKIETYQAEKKIVGIKTRTNNRLEMDSLKGKIFPVVKQYFHQNVAESIPNRVHPGTTFCIYTEYESDHESDYTYFIGEEVDSFEGVHSDLETLVIPAQKYIKFTNGPGSMPDVVRKPWQQVWQMTSAELGGIRSYIADFEIYDERSRDHQNIVLDIYVGIQ